MYTAELSSNLANFLSPAIVLFLLACAWYGFLTKAPPNNIKDKLEKFDIGYFYCDTPATPTPVVVKKKPRQKPVVRAKPVPKPRPKPKPVAKPKPKPKPELPVDKAIYEECISCLVTLGEKKTVAKKTVHDFFTKNRDVKTVEEFIEKVFQK
tara:strand:- start:246 stop:701 length:456 start_codon:yes stop_codon:yes gene_type:complete